MVVIPNTLVCEIAKFEARKHLPRRELLASGLKHRSRFVNVILSIGVQTSFSCFRVISATKNASMIVVLTLVVVGCLLHVCRLGLE